MKLEIIAMGRYAENFIVLLQGDACLYKVFMCIGEKSMVRNMRSVNTPEYEPKGIGLAEAIQFIKLEVNKSEAVIQSYIDKLVSYGLIRYVFGEEIPPSLLDNSNDTTDPARLSFFREKGFPNKDAQLIVTEGFVLPIGGDLVYASIVERIEINEAAAKQQRSLDDKIKEVNNSLEASTVKSIQILSVFAGIMALLFTNVLGVKEFSGLGVRGLLLINASVVLSIFCLLLFSSWLVSGVKITISRFAVCCGLILVLTIPAVLIDLEVIRPVKMPTPTNVLISTDPVLGQSPVPSITPTASPTFLPPS